jgi:alpha-N-arabinofuranosidase
VADAVVVGSLLICLLRHSDRVTSASIAQLVNMIAPIHTEPGGPAWRQTTFYPFALTARHARGVVLRTQINAPVVETATYGEVPAIDAVLTFDEEAGALTAFAVNRSLTEHARLNVDLRAFPGFRMVDHVVLADADIRAVNSLDNPDRVVPRTSKASDDDGVTLPPVSWSMIRWIADGADL